MIGSDRTPHGLRRAGVVAALAAAAFVALSEDHFQPLALVPLILLLAWLVLRDRLR